MAEVVNCDTAPEFGFMGVVFLVLLICSVLVYALVALHSIVNTGPLFAEQWKNMRDSVSEWRSSAGGRGSVSQGRGGVSPITSLCLQMISVATVLRIFFLLAMVGTTAAGVSVPCGSFMELPSTVSWLMMLHDLGTLLLGAVLGGFCYFWREFERLVNGSSSIPRVVIDQWSKWSIGFCIFLTLLVLAVDVLYGFFKGTQLVLLHMAREVLLGYLSIYYGNRMLVLGSAVVRSMQYVVSSAALKTRYLQRAGFGCTLVMGFLRVGNGVLILANPRWIIDFNIAAFAAYTAAEIAFIVSVDAIVQPSHLKQLHSNRARAASNSLSAHRITQSFSSFVLGRIDSPTKERDSDSGKAHSHERHRSFSSSPASPKPPSETSPMSSSSRPNSTTDMKAAAIESLMQRTVEMTCTASDDGTDVEELVVPYDPTLPSSDPMGDYALPLRVRPTLGGIIEEETKEEAKDADEMQIV